MMRDSRPPTAAARPERPWPPARPGATLARGKEASVTTTDLNARIGGVLNRWPVAGLAVGVVRHGSLMRFHGHGIADIEAGTPVDQDTVFRIGSVTKTVTAIAVMQLWEQGLVDLDAPAGDYLTAYQLIPARPGFRPV